MISFILVLPIILFLVISLILKYVFRIRNRILNAVITLVISLAVSSLTFWILPPSGDCGTPYVIFPWTECVINTECNSLRCDPATDIICALTMRAGIMLCILTKLWQYILIIISALVMIVPPIYRRFLCHKVEGVTQRLECVGRRKLLLRVILFIHAAVFLPYCILLIPSIFFIAPSVIPSFIGSRIVTLEIFAVISVILFLIPYVIVYLILKHVFRSENKLLELLIPLLFVLWLWICYIMSWLVFGF